MSKSVLPLPKSGGGRKLFGLLLLALLVWLVIQDPTGAAAGLRNVGHGLAHVAGQVTTFFRSL